MTDFKHVEEQIKGLRILAQADALADREYRHETESAAADTMQALLDEIGRYRAVIEAAQIWERDENRTDETEHNLIMAVQALSAGEGRDDG